VLIEKEIGEATINPSMVILRLKEATPSFIFYYLTSEKGQNQILLDTSSTGVPMITQKQIENFIVPLPPKSEQIAIATALSDTDALIEKLERLITKKQNIKQGAMQELLKPKVNWVMKKLGDLFEITSSKRVFQSEWKNEGVPFYRARELAVLSEKGIVDNELFITRDMYETYKRQYGVPKIGDMLVTGVGTLGKTFVVKDNREFYFKDGNIIWFKINGGINSSFLQQLYLTKFIKKQIEDSSAGTTVGTYTISVAQKTIVPYPPKEEQIQIANILTDMDAEIEVLEKKLHKYKMIKQGMMQILLTGKIRLI
jgi:type I restriction enzyme S subunit